MADWVTISALGTAGGTFALAVATYGSVRSANRAAQVAERSYQASMRPLLVQSRPEDPPEPVGFGEGGVMQVGGGLAKVQRSDEGNIYMAIPLRNIGSGMAVLHGWHIRDEWRRATGETYPDLDSFRQQLRDIYVPPSDTGFWQGALREPDDEFRPSVEKALDGVTDGFTVHLLYGDHEGTQRAISRFGLRPQDDGDWFCAVGRHWNLDGPDPRSSER
jgi:hypothetical protein